MQKYWPLQAKERNCEWLSHQAYFIDLMQKIGFD